MRGYLLITTSGVMFFIIAAVTILHLMSARALNQQYLIHSSYQDILNRISIESIVAYLVDQNESQIQLPQELAESYTLSNQIKSDGSVDFLIVHNETDRQSSFNIMIQDSMARQTIFNDDDVIVNNNEIQGIHLYSTTTTHLVSLRSVWYPFTGSDQLNYYSFIVDDEEEFITANVSMASEFDLPTPRSSSEFKINLYFSSLSEEGVVSLYLKYSDGSIKNIQVEL